jgi:hypothetical protein
MTLKAFLALLAGLGVPIGTIVYIQTLSPDNWIYQGSGNWLDGGLHGAPAPLVGAGLPVLLVGGIVWAVRRFRRDPN